MASVTIVGELHVEVDLAELWDQTLQDYVEQNETFCNVDIVEVVEA